MFVLESCILLCQLGNYIGKIRIDFSFIGVVSSDFKIDFQNMCLMVVLTKTSFNKILIIILVELCVTLTKIVEIFLLKKKKRKLPYRKREKFLVIVLKTTYFY